MSFPGKTHPALLIYRDGRISPDMRKYEHPTVKVAEIWPHWSMVEREGTTPAYWPILHREFRFIGVAGPYAVYEEV